MTEAILDGANIDFPPDRTMECHGYVGIDEHMKPLDLREYYDEPEATEAALSLAAQATAKALRLRNARIDNALPLPEFQKFNTARVFDFVDSLGMEPKGRLAYISEIPRYNVAGLTDYQFMVSLVDQKNTSQYNREGTELDDQGKFFEKVYNTLFAHGVAVHELTHLAGAQDILYFWVDENLQGIIQILNATSTLERQPPFPFNNQKGKYFEEGLATLVHSMYFWFINDANTTNHRGENFETFKSPSGNKLYVPTRLSNPLTSHHEFTNCAWGIERLVQIEPKVWDILIASRRRGAKSGPMRSALRECIEASIPGLFDHMDGANIKDIDETMDVTARIDFEARKYQV